MGRMTVAVTLVAMLVSLGLCTVSKVTMGKMATDKVSMSRMVVTGMLVTIWSPGGCVPCGAAGQAATPQSGSDPQATNTSHIVNPLSYLLLGNLNL